MQYYVNAAVTVTGDGSKNQPFKTIQEAANIAVAGDEVLVMPGIYREDVNPVNSGEEGKPIVYRSVEPLGAWISGAESVKNWVPVEGDVWKLEVKNVFFGEHNPFQTLVSGDWFIATIIAHTGDVFLDGKSMYEVTSYELVKNPVKSDVSWDPEFSVYTWYTEAASDKTIIYANFQGKNPNQENVEISARPHCFYPQKEGVNYIVLSGFKVSQAASQWAPPTAYQEGMIGPHWSKGWIIEDCEVFEAKCSGISLGKYLQPNNDNKWLKWKYKDGTQTERDCIMQAQKEGWTKSRIGHHIVRRCNIHHCGQTGIVGHLGGVFSVIEENHIHHINNKQNLAGAEIGGIKMHAAIDVIFRKNVIHDCTRGIWLDWQAQGTRVTQNLFFNNTLPYFKDGDPWGFGQIIAMGEDVFVEVSHGPTLIDNNYLLSPRSVKLAAQGVAMVHNYVAGAITAVGYGTCNGGIEKATHRYTPYHFPHETEVAGFMTFLHGDARFYNNIYVQQEICATFKTFEEESKKNLNEKSWDDSNFTAGLACYNGYPTFEEWDKQFEGYCGMGSPDSDRYYNPLPVWANGNYYYNGARPWEKEADAYVDASNHIDYGVACDETNWRVETNVKTILPETNAKEIDTLMLGVAFEPEQAFESPDGSSIKWEQKVGPDWDSITLAI